MNKREISIIATEEQKAYLRLKKFRQTARYFYNIAVKKRHEGDNKNAKLYWGHVKEAYVDAGKAFEVWQTFFNLQHQLNINPEKYINAVDWEEIEKSEYNPFKDVGDVSLRFMWAVGKTIK